MKRAHTKKIPKNCYIYSGKSLKTSLFLFFFFLIDYINYKALSYLHLIVNLLNNQRFSPLWIILTLHVSIPTKTTREIFNQSQASSRYDNETFLKVYEISKNLEIALQQYKFGIILQNVLRNFWLRDLQQTAFFANKEIVLLIQTSHSLVFSIIRLSGDCTILRLIHISLVLQE